MTSLQTGDTRFMDIAYILCVQWKHPQDILAFSSFFFFFFLFLILSSQTNLYFFNNKYIKNFKILLQLGCYENG